MAYEQNVCGRFTMAHWMVCEMSREKNILGTGNRKDETKIKWNVRKCSAFSLACERWVWSMNVEYFMKCSCSNVTIEHGKSKFETRIMDEWWSSYILHSVQFTDIPTHNIFMAGRRPIKMDYYFLKYITLQQDIYSGTSILVQFGRNEKLFINETYATSIDAQRMKEYWTCVWLNWMKITIRYPDSQKTVFNLRWLSLIYLYIALQCMGIKLHGHSVIFLCLILFAFPGTV